MDLGDQRASGNIEDRRGIGLGGGLGIGGVVIAIIAAFLGFDPGQVLNTMNSVEQSSPRANQQAPREGVPEDPTGQFVAKVLGSTEDVWGDIFQSAGSRYRAPRLVLYTGGTRTACGMGQAAMGPFYCPNDQQVYLDVAFFNDLQKRFRAPGDFAEAYVIAHEIGHHVQNLTGGMRSMQQGAVGRSDRNRASVRIELQADCYAGVWAYHAAERHQVVPGDVEEAINAAAAVGDDRLQRESQGYVVPESFTHGSSAQRVSWFKRGMARGQVADCDTSSAAL